MDKPYPFNEAQEAWLRDLETTEEPQTNGWLHVFEACRDLPIGYCCLGRACVVLGLHEDFGVFTGTFNLCDTTAPGEVILRANPWNVFLPPEEEGQ